MGKELGRISGPLLASNLLRNGTDLAFDNELLYLNVSTKRLGINTLSAARALEVAGDITSTSVIVDEISELSNFTVSTDDIQNIYDAITISPEQTDPVITTPGLGTSLLTFSGNGLVNSTLDSNIILTPSGTGVTNIRNDVNVYGGVHATGNVTWDGDIIFGDNASDTVTFNSKLTGHLVPDLDNTYDLGSLTNSWASAYANSFTIDAVETANVSGTTTITVGESTFFKGDVVLGSSASDTVYFSPLIHNLVPADGDQTIGSNLKRWADAYYNILNVSNSLQLATNEITSIGTDQNIQLSANGTGRIYVPSNNVDITNDLTVGNTITVTSGTTSLQDVSIAGTVTQTGNIVQTGDTYITGTLANQSNLLITGSSYFQSPNFEFYNNTISGRLTDSTVVYTAHGTGSVDVEYLRFTSNAILNNWPSATTNTQKSVILAPNGTGNVVVDSTKAVILPIGTSATRTLSTAGEVRFNSNSGNIEGYDATGYVNMFNLYSQSRTAYATGELTPGAADNTLRFAVNSTVTTRITPTYLFNNRMTAGNIDINGNIFSNTSTSTDTLLSPSGTGRVKFNDFTYIEDSNIQTFSSGAFTLANTGNGYVKFAGSNGMILPVGTDDNYPVSPEQGTIRFNTTSDSGEVFNGTTWQPIGGSSAVLSEAEVTETMWVWDLILG